MVGTNDKYSYIELARLTTLMIQVCQEISNRTEGGGMSKKERCEDRAGCLDCDFLRSSGIVRTLHTCGWTGNKIDDIGEPDDCPFDNRNESERAYGYDGDALP
jgi:hypothetical protein